MSDPFRLSIAIEHADGRTTRWGPDELQAKDAFTGLTFTDAIPGGYKTLDCDLFRRIDLDYADLNEDDQITVYGPGRQIAWQGRLARAPREHGDQFLVHPGGEGWSAHLADNQTFRMIYVDRDLGSIGEVSRARQLALADAARTYFSVSQQIADVTNGSFAVRTAMTDGWGASSVSEGWYDAGPGNALGEVWWRWQRTSQIDHTSANWTWSVNAYDNDDLTGSSDLSGDLSTSAGPASGYLTVNGRRYVLVQQAFGPARTGGDGKDFPIWWQFAMYGDHGLTRRGTDPGGFYASDIVTDIVERAAPLLDTSLIETDTFTVPHLAFREPTTAEEAIRKVTDFTLAEWGVYDHKRFFWRQPDEDRLCWRARLDEGARPRFDGPSGIDRPNGVMVTYTDFAGTSHNVGPTGSGAETESTDLTDTDPLISANQWGIQRWPTLQLGEPTTETVAIQIGRVWLEERARQAERRGELAITGLVEHPTKGMRPVWEVKAGDYIQLTDAGNDVKRRIIEKRYSHDTRTAVLTLDNSAYRTDAILERLAASVVGAI